MTTDRFIYCSLIIFKSSHYIRKVGQCYVREGKNEFEVHLSVLMDVDRDEL